MTAFWTWLVIKDRPASSQAFFLMNNEYQHLHELPNTESLLVMWMQIMKCAYVYIVWYPREFSRLHNLHRWYWNSLSLLYGLISSHEKSAHFLQLMPFTILQLPFHQVPTTAGWTEAVWNEICPTLLHMTSSGNRTLDLLILSPVPYPLGHILQSLPMMVSHTEVTLVPKVNDPIRKTNCTYQTVTWNAQDIIQKVIEIRGISAWIRSNYVLWIDECVWLW